MKTDLVYLSWNRIEFTRCTFECMLAHTDWSLIRRLHVYDDDSTDGTSRYLSDAVRRCPIPSVFHQKRRRSPVATMLRYLEADVDGADAFIKLDNDIAVPAGWNAALAQVMDADPELEVLGMQAGFTGVEAEPGQVPVYGWQPAPHIGGVGMMRVAAFERGGLYADGRYGFTAWQQAFDPDKTPTGWAPVVRGWIIPDIVCPQLDLLPVEPYSSLSASYLARGLHRNPPFPPYDPASHRLWDWYLEWETTEGVITR